MKRGDFKKTPVNFNSGIFWNDPQNYSFNNDSIFSFYK